MNLLRDFRGIQMTTREECIQILNDLLTQKYNLLENMLDITKLQSQAIVEDDVDELDKLIRGKQTIINNIDRLDEKFNEVFYELKNKSGVDGNCDSSDILGYLDKAESEKLKTNTGKILSIINEIIELEKENNKKLHNSMDHYRNQMKNINVGKKALSVYNKPYSASSPAYFIDKKK